MSTQDYINKIICIDALKGLKNLDSNSIDCVITSPPYWQLRDYGIEGQLGLEPDFNLYIKKLCDIFDEVKRVLKPTGTCFVNLGDSYSNSNWVGDKPNKFEKQPIAPAMTGRGGQANYPDKSLCQIPFRFSIEMVNRGWILRNILIWHKKNCMPTSTTDRFTVDYEPIFFLTKNKHYWFSQQLEPIDPKTIERNKYGWNGEGKGIYAAGRKREPGSFLTKYENIDIESQNRQGMNRERGNNLIEKRNLPDKLDFINTLRKNFTIKEIIEKTKLPKTQVEHWFRYDKGFSFPDKKDWELLETELFPELIEVFYETDDIEKNILFGRNKRAVWSIATEPTFNSHFATFPIKLIEPIISAGCPNKVCNKCGKPFIKKFKQRELKYEEMPLEMIERLKKAGGNAKGEYLGENQKDYPDYIGGASDRKRRILKAMRSIREFVGYEKDCKCEAGETAGIVLDPFIGSGTTAVVAIMQGKNYIGFDLNPDYCKMAENKIRNCHISKQGIFIKYNKEKRQKAQPTQKKLVFQTP